MGQWSKGKVLPENINGNKEFTTNDNLTLDELNAIVNNSFYASDISDNAMGKAQEALDAVILGEGTKVTIDGVPQSTWSADFAESERQKSKNLVEIKNGINVTYSTGMHIETSNDIVTVSGTVTGSTAHTITTFSPKIYNGKTYTLSFHDYSNLSNFEIAVTGTRTDGTKKYNMLNISSSVLSKTITVDNDYILNIEVYSTANKTISGTFKLLLEEGSVATNYVPYYGKISRKGDKEIEFARSEYEKSKNLLNLTTLPIKEGGNVSYSYNEMSLVVSGNSYANDWVGYRIKVKPNTTYILSGNKGNGRMAIYNATVRSYVSSVNNLPMIWTTPNTLETEYTIVFYAKDDDGNNSSTFSYIQLEEGNVATDWQYPYGATVHENQIADVEHVETIYDMNDSNKNTINGVAYTSGLIINNNSFAIDFTKYKRVYTIASNRNVPIVSIVDLTVKTNDYYYYGSDGMSYNPQVGDYNQYDIFLGTMINITKTHITFTKSGYGAVLENGQHSVVKIIGVY